MDWERRPKSDTPDMQQRTLQDDAGRRWTGIVTSGRFEGGEQRAEVLFICEDQPDELKRVTQIDLPPARADDAWRTMPEHEIRELFRRSEPA